MTEALVPYQVQTLAETMQLGDLLAKSGFFADSKGAAQAVVKVLAGREIGFGPIASMTGIHVINGRVSISANLMAAAIKRSGRYDYRVQSMTYDKCVIEFRERMGDRWEVIGNSEFTASDAKTAGTKNMDKYARNMLFARAMSNGARWFTPDIFGGPVYTPEELGAQVDGETGEIIDAPVVVTQHASEPSGVVLVRSDTVQEARPTDLPFRPTVEGAIEWACTAAPQVWPTHSDGTIVTKVVKASFDNLRSQGLTGRELMDAWIAKVNDKLATWEDAQAADDFDDANLGIDPDDGLPFGDK